MARNWPRTYDPDDPVLAPLRAAVAHLPEIHEEETWGTLTFRVGRRLYGVLTRAALGGTEIVFKPNPSERQALDGDQRFHHAPHFGSWLAIGLDGGTDWQEISELLTDSYLQVAPKPLADAAIARLPAAFSDRLAPPPR